MIKKFLSNAMLSLIMDKQAKEKLQAARNPGKTGKQKAGAKARRAPKPPVPPAPGKTEPEAPMDREALIRNALDIHRRQTKILDDLDEGEKKKLQLLAMQLMLEKIRR